MAHSEASFSEIRKIDNSRVLAPVATTALIIFLIFIFIWFFRGGSFRLYASIFFGLYFLTKQVWVSVLLIGILQNLVFLPLRFIGLKLSTSLKAFEDELETVQDSGEQYFLFQQKVKKGDFAVIFYIFNFIVNAIAFFSAGRIFLIDFYTQKLNPQYLYNFIPYPDYPLRGTDFYFPFFKITDTISIEWRYIIFFWLGFSLLLALIRLFWRFFKIFLGKNRSFLQFRIGYNRLLIAVGSLGGTLLVLSTILLRNFPTSFAPLVLVADLTRQNTTMNFITAVGTFLTTIISGYKGNSIGAKNMLISGISPDIVSKIFRSRMKQSISNGLILGAGAFFITNQIPCAFELSIATFEALYIISPFTFDRFLVKAQPQPVAA